MFVTETYRTNKLIYHVPTNDDRVLIAGIVNDVISIQAYRYSNNVLILTDVDDVFGYKFSTGYCIKTDIVKPEFSDVDYILKLSKMLASKLKNIYKTTFDIRKPYKLFVFLSGNNNNNIAYIGSRETAIHMFGMIIFIDNSIVKYNSWFSIYCGKLAGACFPYGYVTDEDYNIIANKVIEMLE